METLLESIELLGEHLAISLKMQLSFHNIIIFLLDALHFSKTPDIWIKINS